MGEVEEREPVWICRTCAVEYTAPEGDCAICADERQWVPAEGQLWTTLDELAQTGHHVVATEVEPDLYGLVVEPKFGIGQQSHIVRTPEGNLMWDVPGYIDDEAVSRVRALGGLAAIVPSHPHHFGVQSEWSQAFGAPILLAEPHLDWVARPAPEIRIWSGRLEPLPGITLVQLGGHFPGSAIAHWAAGADTRGVVFSADTFQVNPDRSTFTFMRSYPNRIPLSATAVQRIAAGADALPFDRVYDNFGKGVATGAREALRRSADRYVGWVSGDFDART